MVFPVAARALLIAVILPAAVWANLNLEVSGDERRVIDLGVFGYSAGGYFSLTVSHFFVDDPSSMLLDPVTGRVHHNESIGFVLDMVSSAQAARYQRTYAKTDDVERRVCYIDDKDLMPAAGPDGRYLYRFEGKKLSDLTTAWTATIKLDGLYALFFFNCKGFNEKSTLKPMAVSFSAEAIQYNPTSSGGKNFLSVGDQPNPTIFGFFTVVFIGLSIIWIRDLKANKQHAHRIHQVMTALVIVKTLSLLFETLKFSHYASTGHASVWDFFYYVFLTAKGMTLFTVVILLGSGWSFLKAMLSDQDKRLLFVILPAQVLVNVCLAVIEETNEGTEGWGSWSDILRVVDVICCCIVLLPIVWSIKNLREASEQDEKAAQTLSRMRLFRTFYIVVVAYIYFTRIIIVMIDSALPYTLWWVSKFLSEAIAVAFYSYSGYKFRAVQENPYLHLSKEDVEELEARSEVNNSSAV